VLNLYGPSEDTTYSTWEVVGRGTAQPAIGRPVDGTRVFLLDPGLRPVPAGVPGELCLGGVGLARGYLNRPDLTAERFVPDPFADLSAEPGARLYRTGDLARHRPGRPDGLIEYLGRTDFQVKVRGFRIELREVETVIDSHPQVRACAVLVRTDPQGDSRLVAYVVPVEAGRLAAPAEIRRWLRSRLPDSMVPATLVPLLELPLTPHGKLDRDALPEPDWSVGVERVYVPPGTPLEEDLVHLWSELLGVPAERIGLRDNFFALGGHSLLATQLIAALRDRVGIEVSLDMIFDTADLGDLADKIMERELSEAGDAMLADMLEEIDGLSPEELQEMLGRPVGGEASP
jgi:acyl carrier protein